MRISDWSSYVCSSDLAAGLETCSGSLSLAGAHLTTGPRWATHRVSFHAAHHRRNLANANHHSKLSHHTRRSEEHTSELQSLMRISYAVFCLKKKTKNNKMVNKPVLLSYISSYNNSTC